MKCNVKDCDREAVTFHGCTLITHGYCEEHRCCAKCGLKINYGCKCKEPKERQDYIDYKNHLITARVGRKITCPTCEGNGKVDPFGDGRVKVTCSTFNGKGFVVKLEAWM